MIDMISSVKNIPPLLRQNVRQLAKIRNKMVHEVDFNEIPDKAEFFK